MNQLNEKLRVLRIQVSAEEMQPTPDLEKLEILRKEESKCLELLRK